MGKWGILKRPSEIWKFGIWNFHPDLAFFIVRLAHESCTFSPIAHWPQTST